MSYIVLRMFENTEVGNYYYFFNRLGSFGKLSILKAYVYGPCMDWPVSPINRFVLKGSNIMEPARVFDSLMLPDWAIENLCYFNF